ncbi:WD-REPEATS-REGION domain-containing protein [Mycena indigotica]|uniref:WD-REPEATS-REGION domain-containing protein n=1 Tax=Mycena indigotica TaxID=2126181 RepID=A0A8H6S9P2_9AGAR|nr:WD-REPEATS-REGION domain-containing protein [Mycena indigotica]KAF7294750.1 WD-REPEATS-REGION domain-containing protein [Mycena indigotica]
MGDEPNSRLWTVASGTFLAAFASTCLTGLYATFRSQPYARLATAAAFNSTVTAATFFSIREYLVIPARQQIQDSPPSPSELSWTDLRTHHLVDSGISGVVTGGLIRGLTAGRRVVLPAALTVGAVSLVLQGAYNELHVQRIKYIGNASRQPTVVPVVVEPDKRPLRQRMLEAVGIRTLSNEEILDKLKQERERHLARIAELEAELKTEK